MKTKIIGIALSLLASHVNAACIPAQEEQYEVLVVSVVTGTQLLKDLMLSKYCYDAPKFYRQTSKPQRKILQGLFKSRSVEDLKLFYTSGTPINYFEDDNNERDLLSFTVSPYKTFNLDKEKEQLAKKYLPNVKINLNPTSLTKKEHDNIMNYIVAKYNKELYTFIDKHNNNNMLHYVVTANNAQVFYELMENQSYRDLFLYKKNNAGFTPIHMIFANKKPYETDKDKNKENTNVLNQELLKYIVPYRLKYLTYNDTSFPKLDFFDFAEILKSNNPDFYKILKEKYNFKSSLSNERIAMLKPKILKALSIANLENANNE